MHVGQHPLDGLIFGDGLAESFSLLGVAHRGFQRALRQAQRLRCDADAAAVERFERDSQALAFFAQAIFCRDAAILQRNFGGAREVQSHFIFVAADAKAGKIWLDQKGGDAAAAGCGVGLREDDVDAGDSAVGDPGFCAVEDVVIAFAHGAGLDSGGVGAGLRFGEAEGAENFAAGEAAEIFFLLRFGAGFPERDRRLPNL